jgi:AcrR family transcriptional regulator
MALLPKPSEIPDPGGEWAGVHPDSDHPIFSSSHRDRLLSGALQAVSEHGYPATTVAQIISVPRISRKTFYEYFSDRQDCVLATYDQVFEWLGERVAEALVGVESWRCAVQLTVETILACFDADPRLADLCAIEVLSLGRPGVARYEASIARLAVPLRAGRARCPWGTELPLTLEEIVVGGAISLIGRRVRSADGDSLNELAPDLTYFLLAPYLGLDQARRSAVGGPVALSAVGGG